MIIRMIASMSLIFGVTLAVAADMKATYTIINNTDIDVSLSNISSFVPAGAGSYVNPPKSNLSANGGRTDIEITFRDIPKDTAPYGYTVYRYTAGKTSTYCAAYAFAGKYSWRNMGHCWVHESSKGESMKIIEDHKNKTFTLISI